MSLYHTEALDPRLSIVRNFFDTHHQKGILYCHWKSNEHAGAAVRGETDLDILFDQCKYEESVKALKDSGFLYFFTPWYRRYPGIEDYLAIDSETGKLVHIHAHFKLVLGEKGVKDYYFNWENEILETRVWNQNYQIYCIQPVREMMLLLIRLALRRKNTADWNEVSARSDLMNFQREFKWLKEKVTNDELIAEIGNIFGRKSIPQFSRIYHEGIDPSLIPRLREIVTQTFQKERAYGSIRSLLIKLSRELGVLLSKFCYKFGIDRMPRKRIMSKRGLIVSFMGADGSGKTTQTRIINQILWEKIDTKLIYMGSGSGSNSIQRRIIKKMLEFASKIIGRKVRENAKNSNSITKRQSDSPTKKDSMVSGYATCFRALSIAVEKKSKLKRVIKARERGYMVICDRYPQNTVHGFNDGPLLSSFQNSRNILQRKIAEYEKRIYARAVNHPPDIVIKLLGNETILFERKPEMPVERIQKKQDGIRKINFPDQTEVVELDATKSIEEITALAMKAIGRGLKKITDLPIEN